MKKAPGTFYVRLPRDKFALLWVCSYYDGPQEGLCRVNGEVMRFKFPSGHGRTYPKGPRFHIFRLNFLEKAQWLLRKKMFEICVGTHWTFPQPQRAHFYFKRPKWFWRLVANAYYGKWAFTRRNTK